MNFKGTRLQKSAKSWRGDDFKKFGFLKSLSSLNLGATQSAVIFLSPPHPPLNIAPLSISKFGEDRLKNKCGNEL